MTTYPKKSKLFQAWSKAMVAGATVDKPDYSKTSKSAVTNHKQRRRRRKRRKRKNAKTE